MLFRTPSIDADLRRRLAELDDLRRRLGARASASGPWLGTLRRSWRAASANSSVAIEGFRVPVGEVASVATGRDGPAADDDRQALAAYARAMDHVGVLAGDPRFRWNDRVLLDLHFDTCWFQRDATPGRYREGGIQVTGTGGLPAYVGPAAEHVADLVDEAAVWLQEGDLDAHVVVRAAMAHLHVVSIHPFRDGNERISRIVQSLVLAREGPLAPEFVSIEEHLGRNTDAYYRALQEVQGGSYQPERDATAWIRFCVEAHVDQARARLEQLVEAGRRWTFLDDLVERRAWPERLATALQDGLLGSVDRAAFAAAAGVSPATATGDLRRLVDAGLLTQRGQGRTTSYVAADGLRRDVEEHLRGRREAGD